MKIHLDDDNQEARQRLRKAFAADEVTSELNVGLWRILHSLVCSVTIGGSDLKTVYIGSLRG